MINPDASPRRVGSDHSIASGIADVYSPARNTPPRNRRPITMPIDSSPIDSAGGTAAMPNVHAAVPAIATRVVVVRPTASEMRPKIIAPSGRPMRVAITTNATVDATASRPAIVGNAGASAVTGRKMLS